MFRKKGFCYTKELIMAGIYQYNARIKELRAVGYRILSQKRDGMFAFTLLNMDKVCIL